MDLANHEGFVGLGRHNIVLSVLGGQLRGLCYLFGERNSQIGGEKLIGRGHRHLLSIQIVCTWKGYCLLVTGTDHINF